MAPAPAPNPVTEPFPIPCIAGRYLLFDVDAISHCRRAHNICGLLIGTIPNLSQQNVFLGIPLELMPEEARVLVERGAAYVVDDVEIHRQGFMEMSRMDRLKYLQEMDRAGENVARQHLDKAEQRKDKALKEKGLRKEVFEKESIAAASIATDETVHVDTPGGTSSDLGFIMKGSSFSDSSAESKQSSAPPEAADTSLFEPVPASPAPSTISNAQKPVTVQKHFVTPTTSYPPLPTPAQDPSRPLPAVPNSYPLFRYLHSRGYFHMPGIRFGCHYNVYPGDPLRYHSHFAATGLAWDEEFDLLDVVGGGRLGTGTKKAYMIGGEDPEGIAEGVDLFRTDVKDVKIKQPVRAFSIEWAAI
ncbi:hypothetical protein IAQ61_003653 [Plenodomus lingam]|uniref:tRNA-splicing endonuclease subunit Sen34 n=1 Tax=Leptosphaeria maculans (strain JN3 / isolate v23.1.3 / race Av1-4-5-6-7-8) TaxID=985895 RepID=E4ZRA1_LEPMJ|nr:similar to tRNA-splicing endonuclease subunit sen34 [Plenodomus lingam JN3]KAH9874464.1 hypothetical protein IAQ61_003653 [Plenodomus lingam]CBX93766.1 similar to tRNA-splicing endonuclease subunit sen34 [Plenodomus lingam JN3]